MKELMLRGKKGEVRMWAGCKPQVPFSNDKKWTLPFGSVLDLIKLDGAFNFVRTQTS